MALNDTKTFSYTEGGLTLQVVATDLGGNLGTSFVVTCLSGYADVNALYWGEDGVGDGSQFNLGGSLNMNGVSADFDGGIKLSSAGLGQAAPDGTSGLAKSTYLTVGDGGLTFTNAVDWDTIDTIGIRATSTSTASGSIKGVDDCAVVTPFNDPPAGADNSRTIEEDGTYTFDAGDFGFSDPNDNPADAFKAVTITTLATNGVLKLDGVDVTEGQSIDVADISKLVFVADADENGTPYANFTFQVQDNGGTANGGQDTDQSPNTFTININPVNDAPNATNDVWALTDTAVPAGTITPEWFLHNDTDIDGGALSVTAINGVSVDGAIGTTGLVADFENGQLVGISGTGVTGSHNFSYTVSDGINTDNANVSLKVYNTATDSPDTVTLVNPDHSYLDGQGGIDTLTGAAGKDIINGGRGSDILTGLGDDDAFVFNTTVTATNIDRITDFSNVAGNNDIIHMDNAIFTGLGAAQNVVLSGAAFASNLTGAAGDASDRVIYESDTGKVFYDVDGAGGVAGVQFATLQAGLNISNADFFVI